MAGVNVPGTLVLGNLSGAVSLGAPGGLVVDNSTSPPSVTVDGRPIGGGGPPFAAPFAVNNVDGAGLLEVGAGGDAGLTLSTAGSGRIVLNSGGALGAGLTGNVAQIDLAAFNGSHLQLNPGGTSGSALLQSNSAATLEAAGAAGVASVLAPNAGGRVVVSAAGSAGLVAVSAVGSAGQVAVIAAASASVLAPSIAVGAGDEGDLISIGGADGIVLTFPPRPKRFPTITACGRPLFTPLIVQYSATASDNPAPIPPGSSVLFPHEVTGIGAPATWSLESGSFVLSGAGFYRATWYVPCGAGGVAALQLFLTDGASPTPLAATLSFTNGIAINSGTCLFATNTSAASLQLRPVGYMFPFSAFETGGHQSTATMTIEYLGAY